MEVTTDREKLIRSHVIPANRVKERTFGIPWESDKLEDYPVYKVPIDILRFNFDNARIKAEKAAREAKLKRQLDPSKEEDQNIVEEILLTSIWLEKADTSALETSLRIQQQQPAIITFDGVVIDGNRRLALYRRVHRDEGKPEYSRMEICILPQAGKKQLIMLENRLQLTRSYRVQYGPVNDRLRLREQLRELKFTVPEIITSVNERWDKNDINQMIEEMDLIDDYLDTIGQSRNYPLIRKIGVESFTNLWQAMKAPVGQMATAKKTLEQRRRTIIGFQVISHPESTYSDLRELRDVLKNPQASREFLANCGDYRPGDPTIFDPKKVAELVSNLHHAYSYVRSQDSDPGRLANQALDKLNHIDMQRVSKGNNQLADALMKIMKKVEALNRKLSGK